MGVVSKLGKKVFDKITKKDQNKPGETVFGKTIQIVQNAIRIALMEGESDKIGDLSLDDFNDHLKDVLVNSDEFSEMEAKELIDNIFLDLKNELSDVISSREISNLRLYLQSSFNELHNWIRGEIAEKLDELYLSLMKDLRNLSEEQTGEIFKDLGEKLSNIKTIIFEGQVIGREVLNELQEAQLKELVELYKRVDIPLEVFLTGTNLIELSAFLERTMKREKKKLEEAVKHLDEIINVISAEFVDKIVDADTLIKTGNVYLFKGEFEKSIEYYEMVLTYNPLNIVALSSKGMALYSLGNIDKALEVLNKAIMVGGNRPEASLAYNNLGYILMLLGNFEGAAENFNKAIDLNPNNAMSFNNMGQLLIEFGDFKTAMKYLDQALSIDPNLPFALNNKGYVLFNLGEIKQALSYFDMAIKVQENFAMAWNNKAIIYINLGRLDEALECCNKAIEYYPDLAIAWVNKGFILNMMGRLEDALIHFDMAEKLEPNNPAILAGKASILIDVGKLFEALEYANRAVELLPNSISYNARGLVKFKMGKIIDAIEDFEMAIKLQPILPIIFFNRGLAYLEIGDSETANESFRKALELDPRIQHLLDEKRISI